MTWTALLLVSIFHFVSSTGYLIHYQNLHKICTICKFKKSLREMHKNMFVLKELVLFHLGPMRVLTHYWHKFPHSHTFCQTLSPAKLVPKMLELTSTGRRTALVSIFFQRLKETSFHVKPQYCSSNPIKLIRMLLIV